MSRWWSYGARSTPFSWRKNDDAKALSCPVPDMRDGRQKLAQSVLGAARSDARSRELSLWRHHGGFSGRRDESSGPRFDRHGGGSMGGAARGVKRDPGFVGCQAPVSGSSPTAPHKAGAGMIRSRRQVAVYRHQVILFCLRGRGTDGGFQRGLPLGQRSDGGFERGVCSPSPTPQPWLRLVG